ncbi:MAG: hypothetical protein V4484_04560 [Pseudomonadota bacterium]
MPAFRFAALVRLSLTLLVAGACAVGQAAELGEPVVLSHIGQPLVADIELTALADPARAVTVRLSSADVYRGANIAMHPVLSNASMSVMRREGRQYLHITSVKPVDSEYLHLFLDLIDGDKHSVRAATLWLTPDPNPLPPPPPPVIAKKPVTVPDEPPRPPKPAIVLHLPSAAPACVQAFSAEQIKSCSENDYKNGLLSAQIVELEEKVKALQAIVDSKAAADKADTKPAVTPALKKALAKGMPTPPLMPLKAAPKPDTSFPWLAVAGGVALLAALGAGVYFFLRRRKRNSVEGAAADTVAWYTKLAGRFKRKPKAVPAQESEGEGAGEA